MPQYESKIAYGGLCGIPGDGTVVRVIGCYGGGSQITDNVPCSVGFYPPDILILFLLFLPQSNQQLKRDHNIGGDWLPRLSCGLMSYRRC